MRGPEIGLPCLALTLAALAFGGACKSEEPAAEPGKTELTKPEAEAGDRARGQGRSEGEAEPGEAAPSPSEARAADPERADKLADLDDLCEAVDHDYVDGTLSDYYRDVEPRTDWGKAQREAGNKSIQPGRLLEKAVAELDPGAKDPALNHCRKLLDYLDDVE